MGVGEVLLIGVGLSMDAVAVSATNGMVYPGMRRRTALLAAALFGLFQALMPCLGYVAGSLFAQFITRYAGPVVLVILACIGGNMIRESFSPTDEEETCQPATLTIQVLLLQAVATSIDAFAVGVGFSAMQVALVPAALLIGCTTFLCSLAAHALGLRFGHLLGHRAELLGGVILIAIGIKAVL